MARFDTADQDSQQQSPTARSAQSGIETAGAEAFSESDGDDCARPTPYRQRPTPGRRPLFRS
jgi:hypothetical protein